MLNGMAWQDDVKRSRDAVIKSTPGGEDHNHFGHEQLAFIDDLYISQNIEEDREGNILTLMCRLIMDC